MAVRKVLRETPSRAANPRSAGSRLPTGAASTKASSASYAWSTALELVTGLPLAASEAGGNESIQTVDPKVVGPLRNFIQLAGWSQTDGARSCACRQVGRPSSKSDLIMPRIPSHAYSGESHEYALLTFIGDGRKSNMPTCICVLYIYDLISRIIK